MSSKRRQYPSQQIAAYEVSANGPSADNAGVQYGYGGQQPPMAPMGAAPVGAPMGSAQLTNQMGQMKIGETPVQCYGTPGYGSTGYDGYQSGTNGYGASGYVPGDSSVYNGYGNYGSSTGPSSTPLLPMNELYTVDLLQQFPPPVNNLDLPPPPLNVPVEASISKSEYANVAGDHIFSTLNVIPKTSGLLKKSKLPFALIIRPFAKLRQIDEEIPVVTDMAIERCRRCRTYINPFVTLFDNNTRWRCSVCSLMNTIPQSFEYDHLNSTPINMFERNEFKYAVVDFLAPQSYVSSPPQPPTYVFLLDVSVNACSVGALQTVTRIIKQSLDKLPNGDGRTRVAFIGVDSTLTFFQIPPRDEEPPLDAGEEYLSSLPVREPRLLVVSDLADPFLPSNTGLLINLKDNRKNIENLLDKIAFFYGGTTQTSNAMGSGLKAAHKLISNVGGKIVCITSSLPTVGHAKLDVRDEAKLMGTKNEYQLYQPSDNFYRSFGVECFRCQVSVDMFLLPTNYQDVASLSNIPKVTGGSTYLYPGWNSARSADVEKLEHELSNFLSQDFGQDGMLRVRCSSGIRSSGFSGHFFLRSSDLMSFPNLSHDQTYVVNMQLDESINRSHITVQGALLYTSAYGERKIRVMTVEIPVSDKLSDIYASADQQAITTYYAHQANDVAINKGIPAAQEYLNSRIAELFKIYRSDVLNIHTGTSGAMSLCSNLSLLPLLLYSLKKTTALRANSKIPSDLRAHALDLLITLPIPYLVKHLYPEFYALHDLPDEAGQPDENGNICLPARLNLTGESLESHGLYLIDDGQVLFLWVSRDVVPQLLIDAFGTDNIDAIPTGKANIPVIESSDLNVRIRNIISASRNRQDSIYWPTLYILTEKSDPSLRVWATSMLVEDRSESEPTYIQYLNKIREKLTT